MAKLTSNKLIKVLQIVMIIFLVLGLIMTIVPAVKFILVVFKAIFLIYLAVVTLCIIVIDRYYRLHWENLGYIDYHGLKVAGYTFYALSLIIAISTLLYLELGKKSGGKAKNQVIISAVTIALSVILIIVHGILYHYAYHA